jgi:tungstate transport system ATP-binding protein
MTLAYTIKDLSFAYTVEPVLRISELEIGRGEIVGLVGPNGSGKTTLLHILAFLETPQRGEITFFGRPVSQSDLVAVRRRVALLLQSPYLFHESVLSNILWGMHLRGVKPAKARQAALKALDLVGLQGFGHRYARSLSGGESQRVALARALALEPSVLLLDEPFSHMDRQAVQQTEEIVNRLCCDNGVTVVFTTHAIEKVHVVAHRLIHLWQGRMVPTGPENLFKGVLKNKGTLFDTGNILVQLENPAARGDYIVIDPSGIGIQLDGTGETPPNTYSGTVKGLSQENERVRVVIDVGEDVTAFLAAGDPISGALRLGMHVTVAVGPYAISVL